MLIDNFYTLIIFAGSLVGTPGPANILLISSGGKYGWRKSLPLIFGVTFGKIFVHLSLALGLWKIIAYYPRFLDVLKIIGFLYILFLAYKVQKMRIAKVSTNKSPGFFIGLLVHPLNPKAWVMVIAAYGQFINVGSNWWQQVIIIAFVFFCWQLLAHNFWCFFGEKLFQYTSLKIQKILFLLLAIAMVFASLWAILM